MSHVFHQCSNNAAYYEAIAHHTCSCNELTRKGTITFWVECRPTDLAFSCVVDVCASLAACGCS